MTYALQYGEFRNKPLAFLRDNDPDYGDAVYLKQHWPKTFDLVKSTYYDESLHVGGPEDKANYEYWKENYAATEGKTWWDLGHQHGILVRIPLLSTSERESYEYLEENFELDEDASQKIRDEVEREAWNDYGRKDYKKAILEGISEDEHDTVEELLDAITDIGFDSAVYDTWSRSGHYPEVSGWEVNIPDADNILTHDENFTDFDLQGVINWLGIGHEVTIRLSPRAFCRLHPEDREFSYPGAVYIRYGEEWVLNIHADEILPSIPPPQLGVLPRGGSIDWNKLDQLVAMHLDDSAKYIGIDQAPSVTMMYSSRLCQSPLLLCSIDYIDAAKLKKLQGPSAEWTEDHHVTDEELNQQREFDNKVERVRNIAIEGSLEVCDVDPTSDLVEQVVEQLLLDDLMESIARPATINRPWEEKEWKQLACKVVQGILDNRPPLCTVRQLKLPGVRGTPRRKPMRRKQA
jgi:hypothetical protein